MNGYCTQTNLCNSSSFGKCAKMEKLVERTLDEVRKEMDKAKGTGFPVAVGSSNRRRMRLGEVAELLGRISRNMEWAKGSENDVTAVCEMIEQGLTKEKLGNTVLGVVMSWVKPASEDPHWDDVIVKLRRINGAIEKRRNSVRNSIPKSVRSFIIPKTGTRTGNVASRRQVSPMQAPASSSTPSPRNSLLGIRKVSLHSFIQMLTPEIIDGQEEEEEKGSTGSDSDEQKRNSSRKNKKNNKQKGGRPKSGRLFSRISKRVKSQQKELELWFSKIYGDKQPYLPEIEVGYPIHRKRASRLSPKVEMLQRSLVMGQIFRREMSGMIEDVVPSKEIRIFISSTFLDTKFERDMFLSFYAPKLRDYCNFHQLELYIADMRWGVPKNIIDNHELESFLCSEIRQGYEQGFGLAFVGLLTDRFGYRPLPKTIRVSQFEEILLGCSESKDRDLLKQWYQIDNNSLESEYRLLPVKMILGKRYKKKTWDKIQEELVQLVRQNHSITEIEMREGFQFSSSDPNRFVLINRRVQNANHARWPRLEQFREEMMDLVPDDRQRTYDLPGMDGKFDPILYSEHAEYVRDALDFISFEVENSVGRALKEREEMAMGAVSLEILPHVAFANEKLDMFFGRDELVNKLVESISDSNKDNENSHVIYLHGESGVGKTSLLAMTMRHIAEEYRNDNVVIVGRFIGISSDTATVDDLVRSLYRQIWKAYLPELDELPKKQIKNTGPKLYASFATNCLNRPNANKRLIIFLDALDQLPESSVKLNNWLPAVNRFVTVVTTGLTSGMGKIDYGDRYNPVKDPVKVEKRRIDRLTPREAINTLRHWLKRENRRLTTSQVRAVQNLFGSGNITPLLLRLIFKIAREWCSFSVQHMEKEFALTKGFSGTVNYFLDHMERNSIATVTEMALALITFSKQGLSSSELEDILSLNNNVLEKVFEHWQSPVCRVPPLMLNQIIGSLGEFLKPRPTSVGAGGLLNWFHRGLGAEAEERYKYLETECYDQLIDYFTGKYHISNGGKSPYRLQHPIDGIHWELDPDRKVQSQSLEPFEGVFNVRPVIEVIAAFRKRRGRWQEFYDFINLNDKSLFQLIEKFRLQDYLKPEVMALKNEVMAAQYENVVVHRMDFEINHPIFASIFKIVKNNPSLKNRAFLLSEHSRKFMDFLHHEKNESVPWKEVQQAFPCSGDGPFSVDSLEFAYIIFAMYFLHRHQNNKTIYASYIATLYQKVYVGATQMDPLKWSSVEIKDLFESVCEFAAKELGYAHISNLDDLVAFWLPYYKFINTMCSATLFSEGLNSVAVNFIVSDTPTTDQWLDWLQEANEPIPELITLVRLVFPHLFEMDPRWHAIDREPEQDLEIFEFVAFTCVDGDETSLMEMPVRHPLVQQSVVLNTLIREGTSGSKVLEIPGKFSLKILNATKSFCEHHKDVKSQEVPEQIPTNITLEELVGEFDAQFIRSMDVPTLMDLFVFASYINLPELFDLSRAYFSLEIRGKSPAEVRHTFYDDNEEDENEDEDDGITVRGSSISSNSSNASSENIWIIDLDDSDDDFLWFNDDDPSL